MQDTPEGSVAGNYAEWQTTPSCGKRSAHMGLFWSGMTIGSRPRVKDDDNSRTGRAPKRAGNNAGAGVALKRVNFEKMRNPLKT